MAKLKVIGKYSTTFVLLSDLSKEDLQELSRRGYRICGYVEVDNCLRRN